MRPALACTMTVAALCLAYFGVASGQTLAARKVSGVVVDAATNRPVAGARVAYDEAGVTQTTTTDGKGYFELGGGELGVVTVDAAGYATNYARWPPISRQSQVRVLLRPPVPFGGTVYDMLTRQPVSAAVVILRMRSRDGVLVSRATMTQSGVFDFTNLLPAAATDRAVYIAHAARRYAPALGTVTIDEKNGNRHVNIGLRLEARAVGQVVDGDGTPVQGATVMGSYLPDYSELAGYIGGETVTGEGGNFSAGSIVPDTPVTFAGLS